MTMFTTFLLSPPSCSGGSTTTTLPVMAVGTFSATALDSYAATSDVAGSDELIAQTFGGNFVSGAPLGSAGNLVAGARRFAEESPVQAGLVLARAGSSDAEVVTGASAAGGIAIRSAALAGGGIFAAGDGDEDDVGGIEDGGGASATVSPTVAHVPHVPNETLVDTLRRFAPGLITVDEYFQRMTPEELKGTARGCERLAKQFTVPFEISTALNAAAELYEKAGDKENADRMRALLRARQSRTDMINPPEAGIIPPYILVPIEIARYMGLFSNPDGSLYQLAKDLLFVVVVQYTNLIVSRWFEMSFEERKAINPKNPDQVQEEWFSMAFAGLLENRGTANSAAPVPVVIGR